MPIKINEIGNKYNHLIVRRKGETKNQRNFWVCQCELCGKEYEFSGTALRKNPSLFDCLTCEKIGQKYGKLTVIEYAYTSKDRHKYWKCKCDCGTIVSVEGTKLRSKHTQSCGCLVSSGELKISQLLFEAEIPFKKQIIFDNCLDKKQLRFDFGVYNGNDELLYLIEFDGIQHFNATGGWNDEQNHEETKRRDAIKNNYCLVNNIPLIRIPYYHQDNLILEDLLITSNYLVKG